MTPENAEEVGLVAEIAQRHGLPLSLRGAGTSLGPTERAEGVSLSFDHMRRFSVRDDEEPSVELEPGILWVELEDHLREVGKSLRVYPTSAPRSTVGGWLARDGLGIGSYEYGWLSENVTSVEVVLPGGARRVAEGEELDLIVGAEGVTGIIVGATLKLREVSLDRPFAAAFDTPGDLAKAVESIADEHPPLWHLGLVHPALSGSAGTGYVLYGTHVGEIGGEIEAAVNQTVSVQRGKMLSSAEAYRSWGARFFPAGPAGDLPTPATATVPVPGLGEALHRLEDEATRLAVQGTVARGGEVLLRAFRIGEEGDLETPGEQDGEVLLRIARQEGGGAYLVGLSRYENYQGGRDALLRLKEEVDPKGILQAAR